jgi:hypothetical protein
MDAAVGAKFVIEIGEVFLGAESGQIKYRIKGFDNLVFDGPGLNKLQHVADTDLYKQGYSDGYKMGLEDSENGYMRGYYDATLKGVEVITEMAEKYASALGEEEN